jgi:hypothetical protein
LDPRQATPAKGTTCCRSFSIGNDLFTTVFTVQMGRGKIQLAVAGGNTHTSEHCFALFVKTY